MRCRPTTTPPGFLVVAKQAHYLLAVQANQPTLLQRCAELAWHRVPVLDRTRDQAHGRVEIRTLKAVTVHHVGFPHAAQVVQVTRKRRALHTNTRRWRTVTAYAITSLPSPRPALPGWPTFCGASARSRTACTGPDVTFAEDCSQVRTGPPRRSWPACATSSWALSRAGPVNVAVALRRHARDPRRPLATLGISLGRNRNHARTPEPCGSSCSQPETLPANPSWVNRPGRRPPQPILESVKGQATQVVSHG